MASKPWARSIFRSSVRILRLADRAGELVDDLPGRAAGATRPNRVPVESGIPASAMVGTSGAIAGRLPVAEESA